MPSQGPDRVIINGLLPYDGEYPFDIVKLVVTPGDPEFMTYREWHEVWKISEVMVGEVVNALDTGHSSLNLAIAVVILRRAGKNVDIDYMWDAPGTAEIRVQINWAARKPEEVDADVPPLSVPPGNEPDGNDSKDGGEPSRPTLVSPAAAPSPIGALSTAISARATSAS